ncbi:MAG: TonB-dependent receptor [Bryobacteraceae bacterium]|nr:carboxypeptidase regulatory-like domain-containing protein [Bryobacterales bacterium]NUN02992.1 TonB-dependent receptor [Bryobacteraceae bacterium]
MRKKLQAVPLFVLFAPIVLAQTAQVTGIVQDSSEAVVVGADVDINNVDRGVRYQVKTNELGYYTVPLLRPGNYRITIQAAGFKPVTRSNIVLETGQIVRIDFVLEVGAVAEAITVSESVPLLQSESSTHSQFIESKTVMDMPLSGRRVENLVTLAGNAMMATGGSRVVLAGGRGGFVNWIVDGGNSAPVLTEGLEFSQSPPVAELKEFRVMLNGYAAEYGQSESGVVTLVTKSGGNQFHGSAYEYLRNDKLDARTFFAAGKAPLRQNLFGFTGSGPIIRNRTFFFVSNEWQRVRRGTTSVLTVPTAAQRNGDFSQLTDAQGRSIAIYDPATSRPDPTRAGNTLRDPFPGNVIPSNRLDPVGAGLAALYPMPNRAAANLAGASNFSANPVSFANPQYLTIKGDHILREHDRIWVKYNRVHSPDGQHPMYPEPAADPSAFTRESTYSAVIGNWAHNFTPYLINELFVNYRYTTYRRGQLDLDAGWPERLGLKGVSNRAFPTVGLSGYAGLGWSVHEQVNPGVKDLQVGNGLNWFRGAHAVKIGGEIRGSSYATYYRQFMSGQLSFDTRPTALPGVAKTGNALASLLAGFPVSASILEQDFLDRRGRYYAMYVQDDWKVRPDLTLNIGMRWETLLPRWDANGRDSGFDTRTINPVSGTPGVVTFARRDGQGKSMFEGDYNNFGPRFGFAWRPFGQTLTVIRGAYGVFYGQPHSSTAGTAAGFAVDNTFTTPDNGITPAFWLREGFPATSREELGPGFGAVAAGQTPRFAPQFIEPNRRISYTHQWNLVVQRDVGWNTAVEIGYIGNAGHKLWQNATVSINQVPVSLMGPGNAQARRPFPQFNDVSMLFPAWGNSNYHSMNLKVEKRFSDGLNFLANYTFAKFIDDVGAIEGGRLARGPQNFYDRSAERALSGNDVRNRVVISSVYELPVGPGRRWLHGGIAGTIFGGWNLGGILTMQQGFPMGLVTQSNTTNAFTPGQQRVDILRDPTLPNSERTIVRWFDTGAVSAPAPYTLGNSGRAVLTGPGLANFDASLLKNHRIGESFNLQFRWESFNFTNHPNFSNLGNALGAANFGVLTATKPARVNQLGITFEF